jgi:hypothetical protein
MISFFKNKYVELKIDQYDRYMEGYNYGQSVIQTELKRKDDKISQLESKVESLTLAMKGSKNANKTGKASRK